MKFKLIAFAAAVCIFVAVCVYPGTQKNRGTDDTGGTAVQTSESTAEAKQSKTSAPIEITLSFTGDCTIGTDEHFSYSGFNGYYDKYGGSYFLKNVKSVFEKDDLTVVNMECVLTDETSRKDKLYAFKGRPEFVDVFTSSSVEAANMANNHSTDYGQKSMDDTFKILGDNGIETFGNDIVTICDVKGVKVGLFGIFELTDHLGRKTEILDNIRKLKDGGAEVIVAVFHWGIEGTTKVDYNQKELAHFTIDEGADLVIGHHPHILQGIETYKGKTIAYSLGNFCFGGNSHPADNMDTVILQKKFTVNGGKIENDETKIIPCSMSSASGFNNYQPTLLEGSDAQRVLNKIEERSQGLSPEQ